MSTSTRDMLIRAISAMHMYPHTTCVMCGAEVCPFEISEHDCELSSKGCELRDGGWVCSEVCRENYCNLKDSHNDSYRWVG